MSKFFATSDSSDSESDTEVQITEKTNYLQFKKENNEYLNI